MRIRFIILCGILIITTLFKGDVVWALEPSSLASYISSLDDSLFVYVNDRVNDRDDAPPYVIKRVAFYIDHFSTTGREVFQQWLDQGGPYIPIIREILREEGLPEDLALLPLIESGFNVNARSPKKATGLWQFMASTGALYGLKVNKWVDERKDPVKSTRAAARHLKDLYNTFGTWPLALISYNAGSGKVRRALARTDSSTFWKMGQSRVLKAETRNYVPQFMAAMIIAKNPDDFGFTYSEEPPIKYDEVEIPGGMDLYTIAENAGVSYESLRGLNPELKGHITPFWEPYYKIRIPDGTANAFVENYNNLPLSDRVVYREYKVKKGDTVYKIARRYGIDISTVRKANSLNRRYRIIPGECILIPTNPPFDEADVRLITPPDSQSESL